MSMIVSRRAALQAAFAAGAAGLLRPVASVADAVKTSRFTNDPFALLGVASGDPRPDGVVLWTRLARDLADAETWGLGDKAYTIGWEVRDAETAGRPVVRQGSAQALKDRGYAVHVEVDGLTPRRRYEYRFFAGDYGASGRTLTAPAAHDDVDKLRFAFCSCAEFENERFYAYDLMARDEPDFTVHLGDYIYEVTSHKSKKPGDSVRLIRFDGDQPITTLAQYRRRYAEYKSDPDGWLKKVHAAAPMIVTWDDHEVANDYAGTRPEFRDEKGFVQRRAAAYRAYFENMPLRPSALGQVAADGGRRIYRQLGFGKLMRLYMMDTRQYRSPQPCPWGSKHGGRLVTELDCPDISADGRHMIGPAQLGWLQRGLEGAGERWNILAQGVPFAIIDARKERRGMAYAIGSNRELPALWTDSWSGYLADHQRVVELMARMQRKNPVVISGDIHNHFVNRVYRDWRNPRSGEVVAPEFICTAISSLGHDLSDLVNENRDRDGKPGPVVYYDGKHNGYVLVELTREALEATMVAVVDKDPAAGTCRADRSARYRVDAGDPEPHKI